MTQLHSKQHERVSARQCGPRLCPIPQCNCIVSRKRLMCRDHWHQVPRAWRNTVLDAWNSVTRGVSTKQRWQVLREAQKLAVAAVCRQLGFPVCRICSCTERFACDPPCGWIELDLCSTCANAAAFAGLKVFQKALHQHVE